MGNRDAYRAFVKMPALAMLLAGAHLGCGGNAPTGSSGDLPGSEGTQKAEPSEQLSAEADAVTAPPSVTDCGAKSTTRCSVQSFNPFRTFGSLQAAINAGGNNNVLTVTGHCLGATVSGNVNLTIMGPLPTFGCGPNGPGPTTLKAEVDGLAVQNSTNVSVQFLNLVNSAADGVSFDNSINPTVSCSCAAFNTKDGVRMTGGTTGIFSQIRSEANSANGMESSGTNTVIITGNRVIFNKGNGILVKNATSQNVSVNIVTNNVLAGILFSNVTASLAAANTIRNNGDGLTNLIKCINDSENNFGNNVPRSCM